MGACLGSQSSSRHLMEKQMCDHCRSLNEMDSISCYICNRILNQPIEEESMYDHSSLVVLYKVNQSSSLFSTEISDAGKQQQEAHEHIELGACIICMAHLGDCVLLTCGHGSLCIKCAKQVYALNSCPSCRSGISKLVRIIKLYKNRVEGYPIQSTDAPVQQVIPRVKRITNSKKK
jgi:Zinc finger, C3HC4 type (RING finger)